MLILENLQESAPRPVLGLPDEEIICQPGMPMTKGPVRAEALAALQLKAQHILWDLGAGSGGPSPALKPLRYCPRAWFPQWA